MTKLKLGSGAKQDNPTGRCPLRYRTSPHAGSQQVGDLELTRCDLISRQDHVVEFSNDLYIHDVYDRNITVDWIEICGQRFEAEASDVESFGVWRSGDGCRSSRFGAGETLHCNGFFAWGSSPDMPSTVAVSVTARGTSGEERLDVTRSWDRSPIISFDLTTSWEDYAFAVPRGTHPSDYLFEFNNDKYIRGVVDRNMIVQKIVFDGREIRTLEPRTFVTGFYNYGKCQPGNNNKYLQTTIIHCNGSFNFERGAPSLDD